MSSTNHKFVSRGGVKLAHALAVFGLDARGKLCVDFGSHVGGFVDCLLRNGALRVHTVDPGYGLLHERLRGDPRVVVHERSNALRFRAPDPCDLATVDVGWTPQRLVLPAVRRALRADGDVITLIKPHYEAAPPPTDGVLGDERLPAVLERVERDVVELGWRIVDRVESPLRGHGGNREFLWRLRRDAGPDEPRPIH